MFEIDDALGAVVGSATQPALAAIKLAWWRERLEELDEGKVPAEPRLQAAERELLPRSVSGQDLALLPEGWAALLEETPDTLVFDRMNIHLFQFASRLLGREPDRRALDLSARLYGRANASRRGLLQSIPYRPSPERKKIEPPLRPLTAVAALARRDLMHGGAPFEQEATPGRALTLLWHRWTGRL